MWHRVTIPPLTLFLFWPTVLLLVLEPVRTLVPLSLIFVLGGNAAIYAVITGTLRRYSLLLPLPLLVLIALSSAPSERRIADGFSQHRERLTRLVQLMNEDQEVADLTTFKVTTISGRTYSTSAADIPLSSARLTEYQMLLRQAGLEEVVRGRNGYFMVVHRFDVPDRIRTFLGRNYSAYQSEDAGSFVADLATYTGYVFCADRKKGEDTEKPDLTHRRNDLPPAGGGSIVCLEPQPRRENPSFRYHRLDLNWFYFTALRGN